MKLNKMKFNENEVRTIYTVLEQMERLGWEASRLGSLTFLEMQMLKAKIETFDYCERNGIQFEDMNDDDYEAFALEEAEADGYAV